MTLRLEKTYADLVSDDGTVCIAYLVSVRWGPLAHRFAGVRICRPDGGRETHRARGGEYEGPTRVGDGRYVIRIGTARAQIELAYEARHPGWRPPGETPTPDLEWSLTVPRGSAVLVRGGASPLRLEGEGYVDRVQLTRPLRRPRLSRLEWGRIHLPRSTVVYTGLAMSDGGCWRRVARWDAGDGPPMEWRDFEIAPDEAGCRFESRPASEECSLRMWGGRRLHRGVAVDSAPDPGLLDRALSRALAGRLTEDRWLRRAGPAGSRDEEGWAIHETVGCGPAGSLVGGESRAAPS